MFDSKKIDEIKIKIKMCSFKQIKKNSARDHS